MGFGMRHKNEGHFMVSRNKKSSNDGIYCYRGFEPQEKCKKIVLSDMAYAKVVSETFSYGENETGGVFIGLICNGIWYVLDMIDAGLVKQTTHTSSYFVYDEEYVNHRIEKEKAVYRHVPSCIGFYHRHPGSMDTFSLPDEKTMKEHCDMSRHGLVSMLVNIDPDFRMSFYYASKQDELFRVEYVVGDRAIPEEFMQMATFEEIAERFHRDISKQESVRNTEADGQSGKACSNTDALVLEGADQVPENPAIVSDMASGNNELNLLLTDRALLERIEKMELGRKVEEKKAVIPEQLLEEEFVGALYGFMADTGIVTVLSWGEQMQKVPGSKLVGYKVRSEMEMWERLGSLTENAVILHKGKARFMDVESGDSEEILMEPYSLVQSLSSRNSGLVESDWMRDATVVISGCGSVGSQVACGMARAGVGNMVLMDPDYLEIHNICRHQLDLAEIGRKKVDAVAEKLRRINPDIHVLAFADSFQQVPLSGYSEAIHDINKTIFIGTCDNRVGNAVACDMAEELGAPFATIGFMPRAWCAEVFTMLPGELNYKTVFEKQLREAVLEERNNHHYMGEEDMGTVTFEPGLDVDITYGTAFFSKIVLDILNRKNEHYHMRIYDTLTQYTLLPGTQDIPDSFYRKYLEPAVPMRIELDEAFYRKTG